jgi:hypothetical protein
MAYAAPVSQNLQNEVEEARMADEASDLMAQMLAWRDAELREELVPYVVESSVLGKMLKHPLVFDVPLVTPGRANEAYDYKTKRLEEALAAEDWHTVVFLHERPYRTWALVNYVVGDGVHLSETTDEIRALAARVWVDSENLSEHIEDWAVMLNGHDGLVLTDAEPEEWDALPETLTIYRGEEGERGFCWSLNKETAEWFARRFQKHGGRKRYLTTATVTKSDVTGYLTGRNETEVLVIHRDRVSVVERTRVFPKAG